MCPTESPTMCPTESPTSAPHTSSRGGRALRLVSCAVPSASVRDVVDLTPSCTSTSLAAAVDALADDPGCDAVLVALGAHDRTVVRSLVGAVERVRRDHPGTAVAVVCPSASQSAAHRPGRRADR